MHDKEKRVIVCKLRTSITFRCNKHIMAIFNKRHICAMSVYIYICIYTYIYKTFDMLNINFNNKFKIYIFK